MIQVLTKRIGGPDINCPSILCDICGKEIQEQGAACYAEDYTVRFVHKGNCHDLHDRQFGDGNGWQDIDVFLVWLTENFRLRWKDARRRAGSLAS